MSIKRMHLTVGHPAVVDGGSCRCPPASDAQRALLGVPASCALSITPALKDAEAAQPRRDTAG